MADDHVDEHFIELVSSVSHANGVFRITLAQQVEAGTARPVTRLLIPANQLQAVLRGVADGANEIREKLQNQTKEGDKVVETDDEGAKKPASSKSGSKK
ncbi:MAG: hypothetical protein COW30_15560 [Rhodospirillales bacterium CG15_BIG_FIL_POST_REV_8_21_14_020_66_15]|nr:MAG: hypothetical protein COW30_15560 [Rhodospirillales bacterium CG15_BIG_FIL_POST_REV_8_21_14_020_66_15]